MCRIYHPSIKNFLGIDYADGKDKTVFTITKIEPYKPLQNDKGETLWTFQSTNNKPMKKYIWAKDTPYYKKGDEVSPAEVKGRLIAGGWIEEAGRWKPEQHEQYWRVSSHRIIRTIWANDILDRGCYEHGNVFKTEEEALAAAEKVKALLLSLHE